MHPPASRTQGPPNPFAHVALRTDGAWVDGRAEALDMALSARAVHVPDDVVGVAFGAEAACLAREAAVLCGLAPPAPAPGAAFVASLESRLVHAFDARPIAPPRVSARRGRSDHRLGLIARLPGMSELTMAAAVVLALGAAAVHDGWRPAPALAATPTTTVHRTQTPRQPTGTATGGTPGAMATAEPVAMAGGTGRVGW